jgi:hypothetical protein
MADKLTQMQLSGRSAGYPSVFLQRMSPEMCRFYGASGEEIISIGADVHRMMEPPMPRQRKPNDLSRSLITLDMDTTLIAVVELSLSSWLVAGIVPGGGPRRIGSTPSSLVAHVH